MNIDYRIQQAHNKRAHLNDPEGAMEDYSLALDELNQGDPRRAICLQQTGVCCKMLGKYDTALGFLDLALHEEPQGHLSAAINRDMADVYRKKGDYRNATEHLEEAIRLLNPTIYPEELGITLSFMGRNERDLGHLGSANHYFWLATPKLRYGQNRDYELFNALDYASFLSLWQQHFLQGRQLSLRALWLTRKAGDRNHRIRAVVLFLVGYRGDWLLQMIAASQKERRNK